MSIFPRYWLGKSNPNSHVIHMVFEKASKTHDIRFFAIHKNGSVPVWEWNKGPCKWNFIGRGELSPAPRMFPREVMPSSPKHGLPQGTFKSTKSSKINSVDASNTSSTSTTDGGETGKPQNNVTSACVCCVDSQDGGLLNMFWIDAQRNDRRVVSMCTLRKSQKSDVFTKKKMPSLEEVYKEVIYDSQFEEDIPYSLIDNLILGKNGIFLIPVTYYPSISSQRSSGSSSQASKPSKPQHPTDSSLSADFIFYYFLTTKKI
eukprot:TRINITY_DN6235_c0_g1_i1.p1 TRINITY_DN6235_c0_g1~~TRINITY_DN6235_c0_g1_i1.p1  ORF type:complete len:260 (+),score=41.86 TRINITY_DN6235_c0_g1_i1:408-1187(+)